MFLEYIRAISLPIRFDDSEGYLIETKQKITITLFLTFFSETPINSEAI